MKAILAAFEEAISLLGLEPVFLPQIAKGTMPRIELAFAGIEGNGQRGAIQQGWEKITFQGHFRSDGTHEDWLLATIHASRRLVYLETNPMIVLVEAEKRWELKAHWKRLGPGRFEYPDEEAGAMPTAYFEPWQVELSYPAEIAE